MEKMIIIHGLSGSGKSTVIKKFLDSGETELMKSYSTREKRINDDNEYIYTNNETFLKKENNGDFIKSIKRIQDGKDVYYGLEKPIGEINGIMNVARNGILDIEIYCKKNNIEIIIIEVLINTFSRYRRLLNRGESKNRIRERNNIELPLLKNKINNNFEIENNGTEEEFNFKIKKIINEIF